MASFEQIFGLAMQLKYIEDLKLNLRTSFNGALLVALLFDDENTEKEKKEKFFNRNKEIVDKINLEIDKFNSLQQSKHKYLPAKPLKLININSIKKIIFDHKGKDSTAREFTIHKLNSTLLETENSIRNFFDSFDIQLHPFLGRDTQFDTNVHEIIKEAFDIYSIGYPDTSVFIMGKGLEHFITEFLRIHIEKKIIDYSFDELEGWSFDTKVNILKKEKLISDGDYSKIMSIKWDRNITGHPSTKQEIDKIRKDADGMIRICINKLVDISERIKEI